MQVHAIIFLFENSGKVGKPESGDHKDKKTEEVDVASFENSSLQFHGRIVFDQDTDKRLAAQQLSNKKSRLKRRLFFFTKSKYQLNSN
jgi:hypothetical protein